MNPQIDTRLARLAPTGPPDPARHAAARAALDAGVRDFAPPPTGVPDVTVDVVVTGRPRRWSRAAFAVAAAAVVGVGVAALLAQPSLTTRISPAARAAAVDAAVVRCQEADPDPGAADPLRAVVSEISDGKVLTFLAAGTEPDRAVFCQEELGAAPEPGGVGWLDSVVRAPVADDRVTYEGAGGGGPGDWYVVWGRAGHDVAAVTVTTESQDVLEAAVADGYWVVWWPPTTASVDRPAVVGWQTHDGRPATSSLADLNPRSAAVGRNDG